MPQRQRFSRFSAVAAWLSSPRPFCRPSARPCPSVPFPQRQQIPRFGAVAAWHSSRPLATDSLNGIVHQNPFHHSISFTSHHTPYPPSTFRRCAVFPRFRPTFRRCVEAAQLRERPVSTFLLSPYPSHLPRCAFSCVFRTPSEGGKIQHRPERCLSPHFSVHRTCSTFQRCRPKRIFPSPSRFRYKQIRHRSTSSWPCRKCRQEGAGRNGILPPPSEIRYMPTCLRVLSRRPCFGFPSRRCRRKLLFTVTFPPPSRHSFLTPSKGVALSHHFSTPSEGVRGSYSALFLPSECLEQFPLHLYLFTPSKGVALSHHFPTPSKGVNPRYRLTSISYLVPAKSCDPAQSML